MSQLSPHFSLAELVYSPRAIALGIDNTPSPTIIENLTLLTTYLEKIRDVVKAPLKITSGYRCTQLNNAIKGSKTSAHLQGLAADISVEGMTPRMLCKKIIEAGLEQDQIILENVSKTSPDGTWVHYGISRDVSRNQVLTMKNGSFFKGLV